MTVLGKCFLVLFGCLSRVVCSGGPVVKTLTSNAEGTGLIPGQETKILHATRYGQKLKNKA